MIWFFITFIGLELHFPDATPRLSAFYYCGTSLINGRSLEDMLLVVTVAAAALVLASARFVRKDIGK